MQRRSSLTGIALLVAVLCSVVFTASLLVPPTEVARGKSAAIPLSDELTPDQQKAQELALADARVQAHTIGQRTEVFGVSKFLDINTPVNALGCSIDNCRVVNIYNFDATATVQAFVRLDSEEVVEVYYQPGVRPGINRRLADRAMEIALNAPEVIEIIGEQRSGSDWAPMDSTLVGSACEQGHMCVAPTFDVGDGYILWAIVDLTDENLVDTYWTTTGAADDGQTPYPEAYVGRPDGGCPPSGSANRNGWMLDYNTTGTDGFRVSNVRYNGTLVITSAKLVEWHADYGGSGYQDSTGCGGGGGGFPIYPFGDTQVLDLTDGGGNVIGFEVVQDFRMGNWGSGCNYRYDQHFQFFADGSFRTVQGAYGKGCGQNSLYRGLMRIDLAAGGTDTSDNIATWNGSDWQTVTNETRWCPEGASHATCTGFTPGSNSDGYRFRVSDSATGTGYYVEPSRGQFGGNDRGDNEFVYAVAHSASEGDNDLAVFSIGCCNDYNHGPEQYVNNQSITDANLVIWYIPQMQTDAVAPDYYCWTLTPPTTYPCFVGPMFVPFSNQTPAPPTAGFSVPNQPYFPTDEAIQFTDTSTPGVPATLTWDWNFGDGDTASIQNPLHSYDAAGTYTVTLTVDNGVYSDTYSAAVRVEANVTNVNIQLPPPGPGGSYTTGSPIQFTGSGTEGAAPEALTYAWTFGDGGSSTAQNPLYTYTNAGSYTVGLAVSNGYFTETVTAPITLVNPPTAVTLSALNVSGGNGILLAVFASGILLLAGATVVLRRR